MYSRFDKKDSNCKEGGKWCDYHETTTHNTKDCQTIKKLKASKSSDGTKEKKQWKSKSDYAKDKAKKELNALKKKASKVKKELNSVTAKVHTATKRKAAMKVAEKDDNDSSYDSLNALEMSMKEIDDQIEAMEFSDAEDGEVN